MLFQSDNAKCLKTKNPAMRPDFSLTTGFFHFRKTVETLASVVLRSDLLLSIGQRSEIESKSQLTGAIP